MNIGVVALGTAGDVIPLLQIANSLCKLGNVIYFVTANDERLVEIFKSNSEPRVIHSTDIGVVQPLDSKEIGGTGMLSKVRLVDQSLRDVSQKVLQATLVLSSKLGPGTTILLNNLSYYLGGYLAFGPRARTRLGIVDCYVIADPAVLNLPALAGLLGGIQQVSFAIRWSLHRFVPMVFVGLFGRHFRALVRQQSSRGSRFVGRPKLDIGSAQFRVYAADKESSTIRTVGRNVWQGPKLYANERTTVQPALLSHIATVREREAFLVLIVLGSTMLFKQASQVHAYFSALQERLEQTHPGRFSLVYVNTSFPRNDWSSVVRKQLGGAPVFIVDESVALSLVLPLVDGVISRGGAGTTAVVDASGLPHLGIYSQHEQEGNLLGARNRPGEPLSIRQVRLEPDRLLESIKVMANAPKLAPLPKRDLAPEYARVIDFCLRE